MEHIIVSNLMKHLEIQNILFLLQLGMESQLLSLSQDLASSRLQLKETCLLWIFAKLSTRFRTNVKITNSTGI